MRNTAVSRRALLLLGLVPAWARSQVRLKVCLSEQHRPLLEAYLNDFGLAGVEQGPDSSINKGESAIAFLVERAKIIGQPTQVRVLGELYILTQALRLGGIDVQFEYVWVPNYARALSLIHSGAADVMAQTIWQSDGNPDSMRLSEVVIGKGKFAKGLYTAESRLNSYKITSAKDLSPYTVVSTPRFTLDWAALLAMPFKAVVEASSTEAMQNLVLLRNVDFLLGEWSLDADLRVYTSQGVLAPVPGVKVGLPGSRHFAFSASNAMSGELVLATNKGLALMQKRNLLERYFTEMGTYRKEVATWKTL